MFPSCPPLRSTVDRFHDHRGMRVRASPERPHLSGTPPSPTPPPHDEPPSTVEPRADMPDADLSATDLSGTERTRLRRLREKGRTDRAELFAVLRAGFVCHLGVV